MPKITYKDRDGNSKTIEVENGLSVMEGAIQNDIPGIDADCGGSMACATCHVYVEEKWLDKLPKAEEAEVDMIDMAFEPKKNSRLSCQIIVSDELNGLEVTTPEKLHEKKPGETLKMAVKRMLPGGVLGRKQLTKLKIYSGSEHPHAAQNPKVIELDKLNNKNIVRN